jgi:hypothetical protein
MTLEILEKLIESATKPGIEGLVGRAIEKRCRVDLQGYFRTLATDVEAQHLEKIDGANGEEVALHAVDMALHNVIRKTSPYLLTALAMNIQDAMMRADKLTVAVEADAVGKDKVGLTAQEAAAYASEHGAEAVKGINAFTQKQIRDLVATGIKEQWGVTKTAREIKSLMKDMTTGRAERIAATEMNDAFSEAAMRKLKRSGTSYKQIILSADACEICSSIQEAGPVPIAEPFVDEDGEEYDRTPIHTFCRCATIGARAPKED